MAYAPMARAASVLAATTFRFKPPRGIVLIVVIVVVVLIVAAIVYARSRSRRRRADPPDSWREPRVPHGRGDRT